MKLSVNVKEEAVTEVKTTWDEDEANRLLSQGWMFLTSGIAHKDNAGFQAKAIFILAKKK